MSWYTTGEILIWLILAAILGFILGWLIHWLVSSRKLEAELQRLKDANTTLSDENASLKDENASLKSQLDDCQKAAEKPAPVEAPARPASKDEALALVDDIAARTAGDEPAPEDDLREVHGIGEVISKMLYSMKITSFRQIARFNADDVATIEKALEFFPDRIVRDDWMSSARQLHIDKYDYDPCE